MLTTPDRNIVRHAHLVSREQRERRMGQRGATVWFTGLSGSGKSTVATRVDQLLTELGVHSFVLDGDNVRHGLCRDLGFSPRDRDENIRRIGEVARLFTLSGVVNLVAFISPYRAHRDRARASQLPGDFIEVFVDAPLAVCEGRDPKGLYRKARAGEIPEFTGISAPYEAPRNPELTINTAELSVEESAQAVVDYLVETGIVGRIAENPGGSE